MQTYVFGFIARSPGTNNKRIRSGRVQNPNIRQAELCFAPRTHDLHLLTLRLPKTAVLDFFAEANLLNRHSARLRHRSHRFDQRRLGRPVLAMAGLRNRRPKDAIQRIFNDFAAACISSFKTRRIQNLDAQQLPPGIVHDDKAFFFDRQTGEAKRLGRVSWSALCWRRLRTVC